MTPQENFRLFQVLFCCPLEGPGLGRGAISWPFLLQKVKRVVGIELCQEAVEDARVNALDNGESQRASQWVAGLVHPSTQHLGPTQWLLGLMGWEQKGPLLCGPVVYS